MVMPPNADFADVFTCLSPPQRSEIDHLLPHKWLSNLLRLDGRPLTDFLRME